MRVLLANPAGLWALLAVPAILLIHFLQERSRRARVSTLFLLDRVRPESRGGARLERLRNSLPLWLQIIAALIVAWMLAEPRWIREDSRQTVAVVLDSSVSMSVFKEPSRRLLQEKLQSWAGASAETEWHLLESDLRKPTLYAGPEMTDLLRAYDDWKPVKGSHRPDDVLTVARGLVKGGGIVIFLTDRKVTVPGDVALLSAAEPLENVGFAGIECRLVDEAPDAVSGMKWRALVRNYSERPQSREWWIDFPGESDASMNGNRLELAPGQTIILSGEFPSDVEQARLTLKEDRFKWDDQVPLQKPKSKLVNLDLQARGPAGELLKKILGSMPGVRSASVDAQGALPPPDLTVAELGTPVSSDAIQIAGGQADGQSLDSAFTVGEDHPLTRDLNWTGLLTPQPLELTLTPQDEPLLWKGGRVLALLRHGQAGDGGRPIKRLLLGWSLAESNAGRHPALVVMLHRYVEQVRESKHEPWAGNFETGQPLKDGSSGRGNSGIKRVLQSDGGAEDFVGRVPDEPGFFEITSGGAMMIRGAASFADTREADFREATALDTVEDRRREMALRQSEADPFAPVWLLALLGCLLGAWGWNGKN